MEILVYPLTIALSRNSVVYKSPKDMVGNVIVSKCCLIALVNSAIASKPIIQGAEQAWNNPWKLHSDQWQSDPYQWYQYVDQLRLAEELLSLAYTT